jgi:pimeloyl-ACP methyl ester carboxylesterase
VFASSRGYQIRYQVFGSAGPALVLLHGLFMWGDRWRDTGYVDALKDQFRVIVPDLIGHGQSDKPHDPVAYARKNMAADVLCVLDHAGVERAHLWGYSMGTRVAEAMAVLAPGRVASLVLGGAPLGMTAQQWRAERSPTVPQTWEEMFDPALIDFFKEHNDDFAALQAWHAEDFADDFAVTTSDLQAAPHPTLAYVGADDGWRDLVRQQAEALPCRLELVPGDHAMAFRQSGNVLPRVLSHLNAGEPAGPPARGHY